LSFLEHLVEHSDMISPMWVAVGLSNAHTAGPSGVMRTARYWFMFIAMSSEDSGLQES